jgi:erythrocyte band 7 integral membrane protein
MRQAADILSSAPAMQIRYLEAMQAMAKSANSKVIFLPAANQTMPSVSDFKASLEPPGESSAHDTGFNEFGGSDHSFQQAINSRIVENI